MPGLSDLFPDAMTIGTTPELAAPSIETRERDILLGPNTAAQPDNQFISGRYDNDANVGMVPELYDSQIQVSVDDLDRPPSGFSTELDVYAGRITAVQAAAFTYSAQAWLDSSVQVSEQLPLTRRANPTEVYVQLAPVNSQCLIIRVPAGTFLYSVADEKEGAGLFAVVIAVAGGSAGNATTQASWTYTVTDLFGNQLGAGMTPLKQRPTVGSMSAGDAIGSGYYNATGNFVLWDAGEVPNVATC